MNVAHGFGDGERVSASAQSRVGLAGDGQGSRTIADVDEEFGVIDRVGLRSYQRAVFDDHSSGIVVLHWSRQIGKSYVLAAWAVHRLLIRPGRLVTVLSNSRENGAEFLTKCAEICALNGSRFETVVRSHPKLEFEDMRMELRIRAMGKTGRIKVLAANPRTARGFSGDLILDEFAFHEDGNKIWEAAEPILASNKDFLCRIASTGNGKRNLFYRMTGEGSCSTTDEHGLTQMGKAGNEDRGLRTPTEAVRGVLEDSGKARIISATDSHRPATSDVDAGNRGASPGWVARMEAGKVVAGMIVDGVAYIPGSWSAEQVAKFRDQGSGSENPRADIQGPKLEEIVDARPHPFPLPQERVNVANDSEHGECALASAPSWVGLSGEGEEARTSTKAEHAEGLTPSGGNPPPYVGGYAEEQRPYYFVSRGGFKVSRVTRTMAHSMGVPIYDSQTRESITPEQARAQALDKAAYDQNYECSFADESLALLTHELISAAECDEDGVAEICEQNWTLDALELMRQAKSPLYAGLDVGRKVDLSVITVLERVGNVFWVRGMLRMKNMRLPEQEERLQQLRQCRQVRQICIDMTGLGLGLFEYAQRTMGEHMISGINFSSSVSATRVIREEGRNRETVRVTEAMAMELLRVYEDRRIRQPRDWQLREDLRRPGKVTSPAGRVSIAATRDGAGHADHFWSVALALEAAGGERVPWAWQAIPRRNRGLLI